VFVVVVVGSGGKLTVVSHGPFHLGQSSAHHVDRLLHLRCLHLRPRRDVVCVRACVQMCVRAVVSPRDGVGEQGTSNGTRMKSVLKVDR
jgi:hypothetical protein